MPPRAPLAIAPRLIEGALMRFEGLPTAAKWSARPAACGRFVNDKQGHQCAAGLGDHLAAVGQTLKPHQRAFDQPAGRGQGRARRIGRAAFWWLCRPGKPCMSRRSIAATCRSLPLSDSILCAPSHPARPAQLPATDSGISAHRPRLCDLVGR
jgi:hypothetical protein